MSRIHSFLRRAVPVLSVLLLLICVVCAVPASALSTAPDIRLSTDDELTIYYNSSDESVTTWVIYDNLTVLGTVARTGWETKVDLTQFDLSSGTYSICARGTDGVIAITELSSAVSYTVYDCTTIRYYLDGDPISTHTVSSSGYVTASGYQISGSDVTLTLSDDSSDSFTYSSDIERVTLVHPSDGQILVYAYSTTTYDTTISYYLDDVLAGTHTVSSTSGYLTLSSLVTDRSSGDVELTLSNGSKDTYSFGTSLEDATYEYDSDGQISVYAYSTSIYTCSVVIYDPNGSVVDSFSFSGETQLSDLIMTHTAAWGNGSHTLSFEFSHLGVASTHEFTYSGTVGSVWYRNVGVGSGKADATTTFTFSFATNGELYIGLSDDAYVPSYFSSGHTNGGGSGGSGNSGSLATVSLSSFSYFGSFIVTVLGGFLSFEIFPGLSFGGIFSFFVAVCLALWLLKILSR